MAIVNGMKIHEKQCESNENHEIYENPNEMHYYISNLLKYTSDLWKVMKINIGLMKIIEIFEK